MTQELFKDRVFQITLMGGTSFIAHMRLPAKIASAIDEWVAAQGQEVYKLDIYKRWQAAGAIHHREDYEKPALTIYERDGHKTEYYFRDGVNYHTVETPSRPGAGGMMGPLDFIW